MFHISTKASSSCNKLPLLWPLYLCKSSRVPRGPSLYTICRLCWQSSVLHPWLWSSITEVLCQLTACVQATGRYSERKGAREKVWRGETKREREFAGRSRVWIIECSTGLYFSCALPIQRVWRREIYMYRSPPPSSCRVSWHVLACCGVSVHQLAWVLWLLPALSFTFHPLSFLIPITSSFASFTVTVSE